MHINNKELRTNRAGVKIIQSSESLRLVAYICPSGKLTIGWGHTGNVKPKQTITAKEADAIFAQDLLVRESIIKNCLRVPVNKNEFSALVSLVYNIGGGAFAKSCLLRMLNSKIIPRWIIAKQFTLWRKDANGISPGLVIRRAKEKELFLCKNILN